MMNGVKYQKLLYVQESLSMIVVYHDIYMYSHVLLTLLYCLFVFVQMNRDNIKNYYNGEGEPPFCEITANAVPSTSTPPELSFIVNFDDHIKELKIERAAEWSVLKYCLSVCSSNFSMTFQKKTQWQTCLYPLLANCITLVYALSKMFTKIYLLVLSISVNVATCTYNCAAD